MENRISDSSSRLPMEQLAQLEYDKSVQFFAIVPLAVIIALAIAYCALYFYRRSRTWNDLGEAMRVPQRPASAPAPSRAMTNTEEFAPPPRAEHSADVDHHERAS